MFSNSTITLEIFSYLTLDQYAACSRTSKAFKGFALQILKQESLFFGGTEENCYGYLKGLCSVIRLDSFQFKGLNLHSALLRIRNITLSECATMIDKNYFCTLMPLIQLSPLSRGPSVFSNESLLETAILKGYNCIVARALEFTLSKDTYLLYAIKSHNPETVRLTLPTIKNINFTTPEGTPLLITIKELCKTFAKYEDSRMYFEAFFLTKETYLNIQNLQAIIILLIKKGAQDLKGEPQFAFDYCLTKGEFRAAKLLKDQGLNYLNCRFDKGENYLHLAMRYYHMSWLLDGIYGFEHLINQQNDQGYTPLHIAMMIKYVDGISFLLENGADLSIVDNLNNTPDAYYTDFSKHLKNKIP